jgi:hypothetical protein
MIASIRIREITIFKNKIPAFRQSKMGFSDNLATQEANIRSLTKVKNPLKAAISKSTIGQPF